MAARNNSTEDPQSRKSSEQIANMEAPVQGSRVSDVLKIRDFRFLFISVAVLIFAFEMRTMAQSWLALELTDSQAWVGIVNGVPAIAVIALTLFGGVIADRYPKRTILILVRAADLPPENRSNSRVRVSESEKGEIWPAGNTHPSRSSASSAR